MAKQQSTQGSSKRTAKDLENLKEDVSLAAQQAGHFVEQELGHFRQTINKTANQVSGTAKRHPGWTAGLMFGAGTLLGALFYGAFRPRPTGLELFGRGLKNAWGATRDSFSSGYDALRKAAR